MKKSALIVYALNVLFFVSCSNIIDSETAQAINKSSISGILTLQDGATRADRAMVILRPAAMLGMVGDISRDTTIDTTFTNNFGHYEFQNVQNDQIYSIEARKDNNAVYIKSVPNMTSETVDLGTDTLKPTGAITGSIYLSGGGNYQNVYILAFGIDRFVHVNADGTFYLKGLGEGNYALRIISAIPDYGIVDPAALTVVSSCTTDIGRIVLPFTGIPRPSNVNVSYDEHLMVATVSWASSTASSLIGYNVYLRTGNSNFEKISDSVSESVTDSIVTDTFYRVDLLEHQNQTIQFAVTAVDSSFVESGFGTSETKILSSSWCGKTINFENGYPLNNDGVYLTFNKIFILHKTGTQIKNIIGYDSDGKSTGEWNPYTSNNIDTSGKFFVDMIFDNDGNYYISENERICKFDSSFNFIDSISGSNAVSYLPTFANVDNGIICVANSAVMVAEGSLTRFYDTKLKLLGTWKTWAGRVEDFRVLNDTIALVVDIAGMMQREKWIVYLNKQFNELSRIEMKLSELAGGKVPGKFDKIYIAQMELLSDGGFIIHAGGKRLNESLQATMWLWEFDSSRQLHSRVNLLCSRFLQDKNGHIFTDNWGNKLPEIVYNCR
ncbi:MAG: hypothetical protein JW915_03090 [Chitinispirillaceae bacterium]|nr:hypothetical protein [Chitinispirillaceae bacterium]